jgi:hypothetical protein
MMKSRTFHLAWLRAGMTDATRIMASAAMNQLTAAKSIVHTGSR